MNALHAMPVDIVHKKDYTNQMDFVTQVTTVYKVLLHLHLLMG